MFEGLFKRRSSKFYTWTKLDGSPGGQVSRFASIDPSATVEKFAVVCSGTTLGPDALVRSGDIVDGNLVINFGPSLRRNTAANNTHETLIVR